MDSNKQKENENVARKRESKDSVPRLQGYIAAHACSW